jgi:hypothetical protein
MCKWSSSGEHGEGRGWRARAREHGGAEARVTLRRLAGGEDDERVRLELAGDKRGRRRGDEARAMAG